MPRQVKISQIVIPKYLPLFNNRTIKHIILTSGRAGTKSSFAAIRADFQLIDDPDGSIVVLRKHHNKLRKTVYKENEIPDGDYIPQAQYYDVLLRI